MSQLQTTTNETDARFVKAIGDPQHAGFQLIRRWEKIHPSNVQSLVTALNAVDTYTNGHADKKTYTGPFLNTILEPDVDVEDHGIITQTLTKIKNVALESDADLVEAEGDPMEQGSTIDRAWYYISPMKADTIYRNFSANDTYLSHIHVDNQSYAGPWACTYSMKKEDNRTITILNTATKVKSVDSAGDLTDPLIDRQRETYHPFGEGRGTGDNVLYRYKNLDARTDTKCMAFADTKLEVKCTPTGQGWDLVDRKTKTEDDNTMTFYLLFRHNDRIKWTSTLFGTPHQRMIENGGRDNELRIKKWFGIMRECHTTALTQLQSTANVDTNFALLKVEFQDVEDGAKDYQRYMVLQSGDTRTDSEALTPHGLWEPKLRVRTGRAWNRLTSNLPTDISMKDTGWNFNNVDIQPDANGLFKKEMVQSQVAWPNTTPLYDSMSVTNLGGPGRTKLFRAGGMPIHNALTTLRTLTGDSVVDASITELDKGGARLDINRRIENRVVTEVMRDAGIGSRAKTIRKAWLGLHPDNIDSTYTNAAIPYAPTGYIHDWAQKKIDADGWGDVYAEATDSKASMTAMADANAWHKVKYYIEKSYRKPLSNHANLPNSTAEGYYWRKIYEHRKCVIKATSIGAENFISDSGALVGSFSKDLKNGFFYAEKVDSRAIGHWNATSLATDHTSHGMVKDSGDYP